MLAAAMAFAPVHAQDAPRPHHVGEGTAAVQTRTIARRPLQDGAARAFARAYQEAEDGGWDVQRIQVFKGFDERGEAAVEALVELRSDKGEGSLGIFLGSRYADTPDAWVVVPKEQLLTLQEAAGRCR
jgi:hypothetical protein